MRFTGGEACRGPDRVSFWKTGLFLLGALGCVQSGPVVLAMLRVEGAIFPFPDHAPDGLGVGGRTGLFGQCFRVLVSNIGKDTRQLWQTGGRNAQYIEPEPHQNGEGACIASDLTTERYWSVSRLSCFHDPLHKPEHGRMKGVEPPGHPVVSPIGGKNVLRQVVGADGHKVGDLRKSLCLEGHGGDLDHCSNGQLSVVLSALIRQPVCFLLEQGADPAHLVEVGHHRDQHAERSVGVCTKQGPDLRAQKCFWPVE